MKRLLFALPVILLVAAGCNSSSSPSSTTNGQQQSTTVKTGVVEITSSETLSIVLDPKVSIEKQITLGNYKTTHAEINSKNFSLTIPTGKREVILYQPHGYVTTEQVTNRIATDGCKAATLDDALAIGTQYPDRQLKNPLVFFGTAWNFGGRSLVPILDHWDNDRVLEMGELSNTPWGSDYRFVAVCKP